MQKATRQSPDDADLLARILRREAGWRDLLALLLHRHHRALVARCHGYLKNRADAEDAAQETELRVYRSIFRFRGDSTFRTWLFAIADRQCHDLSAKRMRHMLDGHLRALIEVHERNRQHSDFTDELRACVAETLSRLPEKERDVLVLRYHRELALEDIAGTLGIGLSAAKMRLYRALEKLADNLPDEVQSLYA